MIIQKTNPTRKILKPFGFVGVAISLVGCSNSEPETTSQKEASHSVTQAVEKPFKQSKAKTSAADSADITTIRSAFPKEMKSKSNLKHRFIT